MAKQVIEEWHIRYLEVVCHVTAMKYIVLVVNVQGIIDENPYTLFLWCKSWFGLGMSLYNTAYSFHIFIHLYYPFSLFTAKVLHSLIYICTSGDIDEPCGIFVGLALIVEYAKMYWVHCVLKQTC